SCINDGAAMLVLGSAEAAEKDGNKPLARLVSTRLPACLTTSWVKARFRLPSERWSVLERIQGRYALVTMCIGGGQGIATIFERV
ncbi:MAG: 3-oxoadipyl-CoA thiolase, partial [Halomonas sp.]